MINKKIEKLAIIFQALGHPVRLRIVKGLMTEGECQVGKIVKNLKLPQSTISQHLAKLRSSGILKAERKGVSVCYRILDPLVKDILNLC